MKIESILLERRLITEKWNDPGMILLEQKVLAPFVKDIENYVMEAELTADQIKQIFANTEKAAVAGGGSRTLVGKGVDAGKFINKKIDELGSALKNAGPVKNIDAKFNELKAKIGAKDSAVVNGIKAVSDWAIANPGKASVAVAVLTIAASMAAGPLGGAIGGFLARATKDLLQGSDLSSAVGKSVKTAAYGAIAGWALNGIGDWLEGLRFDAVPYEQAPGLSQIDVGLTKTLTAPGFSNIKDIGSIVVPADQVEMWTGVLDAARGGDVDSFNELWQFAKDFDIAAYAADMNFTNAVMKQLAAQNDSFLQNLTMANDAITAVAQGSIAASDDKKKEFKVGNEPVTPDSSGAEPAKQESYYVQSRALSEGQVYLLFKKIDQQQSVVMEGPMDLIKKGVGAVGKAASWAGKQATEKVTSAKLFAAWKLEGSPTDSEELRKFLTNYGGITPEVIDTVYTQMKLPAAGQAGAVDIETVKQMLTKLPIDSKVKLLRYLTKQPETAAV